MATKDQKTECQGVRTLTCWWESQSQLGLHCRVFRRFRDWRLWNLRGGPQREGSEAVWCEEGIHVARGVAAPHSVGDHVG